MNKKFPLICFDLDGTLVDDTIYIWKTLHEGFQTNKQERDKAFADYFAGRISYEQWFAHDLKLLRASGATRQRMMEMCGSLKVMHGAIETLQTLKRAGHKVAVISGSIQLVLDVLFPAFTFDYVLVNQIDFDASGQISGGTHTSFDIEAKADGLKHLCEKEGISTAQAMFVGDNENDIWIAKEAGYSIAFNCKSEKLSQICDVEIREKNMKLVLSYVE